MLDLIRALLGPRHCDWCTAHDPTWFDRLLRFDQCMVWEARRWHERLVMKIYDMNYRLGIWKLGGHWHQGNHADLSPDN